MPDTVIRPTLKFILAGYATVVAGIVGAIYTHYTHPPDGAMHFVIGAVLFLLWPAQKHVKRNLTHMTMEGDRLRYVTGLLTRTTRTLQLAKIQDVRVDQTLSQRLFGVGNLSIETAGETSRLTIPNIDSPVAVADTILNASNPKSGAGANVKGNPKKSKA